MAADSLLVIDAQVVQAPNDKQEIEPMLERIDACRGPGKLQTLLAEIGYFSETNVALACGTDRSDDAQGRQSHHPPRASAAAARWAGERDAA